MRVGAFKNIFLSLNFTTKHIRQRLFALVIHSVMCSIAGALGQATCGEDVRSSAGVACSEEQYCT